MKIKIGICILAVFLAVDILLLVNICDSLYAPKKQAPVLTSPEIAFAIQTDNFYRLALDSIYSFGYCAYENYDTAAYFFVFYSQPQANNLKEICLKIEFFKGWLDAEEGKPNRFKPNLMAFSKNPDRKTGVFIF
ncbi:MAG: hypothetical protein WCT08_04620 [Patescibacteria group bacterium]|jgi:hypothetical protein